MFASCNIFMDIMSLMKTKKRKGIKQDKTNCETINSVTANSYKVSPKWGRIVLQKFETQATSTIEDENVILKYIWYGSIYSHNDLWK